jgi:hypothetical protein
LWRAACAQKQADFDFRTRESGQIKLFYKVLLTILAPFSNFVHEKRRQTKKTPQRKVLPSSETHSRNSLFIHIERSLLSWIQRLQVGKKNLSRFPSFGSLLPTFFLDFQLHSNDPAHISKLNLAQNMTKNWKEFSHLTSDSVKKLLI